MRLGNSTMLLSVAALLIATQAPAVAQDRAEVVTGDVTIAVVPGVGIAATLDLADGLKGPDGVAEYLWMLQIAAPIPPELPLELPGARVLIRHEAAVVDASASGWVVALLGPRADDSEKEIARRFGEPGDIDRLEKLQIAAYRGYGLSDNRGARLRLPLVPSQLAALFAIETACDAGGPGAISCSIGCGPNNAPCMATCGEGMYACCGCAGSRPLCSCLLAEGNNGFPGGSGGSGGNPCTGTAACPAECISCTPAF